MYLQEKIAFEYNLRMMKVKWNPMLDAKSAHDYNSLKKKVKQIGWKERTDGLGQESSIFLIYRLFKQINKQ